MSRIMPRSERIAAIILIGCAIIYLECEVLSLLYKYNILTN